MAHNPPVHTLVVAVPHHMDPWGILVLEQQPCYHRILVGRRRTVAGLDSVVIQGGWGGRGKRHGVGGRELSTEGKIC